MKAFAKFMTVVTVLVLLALGYLVKASKLIVRYEGMTVTSCADYQQQFDTIRDYAVRGTSDVTLFTDAPGVNSGDYNFVTYRVNVKNLNALDAEWMNLTIQSKEGDLLQVNAQMTDLAAFNDGTMEVTLLCTRGTNDLTREATLAYYVYGRYYEIDMTLNG